METNTFPPRCTAFLKPHEVPYTLLLHCLQRFYKTIYVSLQFTKKLKLLLSASWKHNKNYQMPPPKKSFNFFFTHPIPHAVLESSER